jgi:hypothetical protein
MILTGLFNAPFTGLSRFDIPQALQGAFVIGPAGLDLDPKIEHYFGLKTPLHIFPGVATDSFQAIAILAYHNFFLAHIIDQD